eukprot:5550050-Prymnesium_polylepis.1
MPKSSSPLVGEEEQRPFAVRQLLAVQEAHALARERPRGDNHSRTTREPLAVALKRGDHLVRQAGQRTENDAAPLRPRVGKGVAAKQAHGASEERCWRQSRVRLFGRCMQWLQNLDPGHAAKAVEHRRRQCRCGQQSDRAQGVIQDVVQ